MIKVGVGCSVCHGLSLITCMCCIALSLNNKNSHTHQVFKNFSIVITFLIVSRGASFSLLRGKLLLADGRDSPPLTKSHK